MQEGKWLSKKALQIAEKRREVKGKGDRERYTQLSAEFQRIARRDNQTFLNEQCKETEENNGKEWERLETSSRKLECKSRKSRDTWSNRHVWPWSTK